MVRIKAVFPFNYYLLRKVKIKAQGKPAGEVGHKQVVELDVPKGAELEFKLDYHKTKLQLPDTDQDLYVILYFYVRPFFPFNLTDVMFRSALRAKVVDKKEFEAFSEDFYKTAKATPLKLDLWFYLTLIISLALAGFFAVYPAIRTISGGNFVLIIGILTFIGFLITAFRAKRLFRVEYYVKILAFSILSILLLAFLRIELNLKLGLLVLSAVLLVKSLAEVLKK